MYIQVRTVDAKTKITLDVSKTCNVSELKKQLECHFNIKPQKQRLFFRGKQLEDEYTLFDYSINLNDMIQIMEKVIIERSPRKDKKEAKIRPGKNEPLSPSHSTSSQDSQATSLESSKYFIVGEFVDVRDMTYGAWFEGKILEITKDTNYEINKEAFKEDEAVGLPHDGFFYKVGLLDHSELDHIKSRLCGIRPRARNKIPVSDIKVGDKVLANYNIEMPTKRGFWYDCEVTKVKAGKKNELVVNIMVGSVAPLEGCKIVFTDEVMPVMQPKVLSGREPDTEVEPEARLTGTEQECDHCKNNPRRKCKECGCHVCGSKADDNKQIMCDECDYAFHIWCLKPPLEEIPDVEEWFCPECKNDENEIVSASSKLKQSKKQVVQQSNTSRDWGKGMACVARTKACTIVPNDHFGPIPGIEVGTLWKFRIQASEAGVHRPHVAGIHGRENIGAFSVVLSGGYEDDVDNGDEVYYTGSGGRDLSGNKRTNAQGFDQTLSRFNRALAINCNVPLNEKGAEAKDWKAGKPVRVVRNYKLAKHSKYAPEEGNRYDGIYKVVKYFPKKGKSGLTVWRFLLKRDDPIPAPWTKEGKKRCESLGLEMQYPEGYLEALEATKTAKDPDTNTDTETPKSKGKGKKRVLEESPNPQPQAATKKPKIVKYKLERKMSLAIENDTVNEKLWDQCKIELDFGKPKFLAKVEETFTCICCTELVFKPITTPCHHNFCVECLKRSFKAEVMTCATCRSPLDKDMVKNENSALQDALNLFFPGYTGSR